MGTPTKKSTSSRDTVIIAGALVIVVAGYFLFRDRQEPPQPPKQASAGMNAPHGMSGDMGGGFLDQLPSDYEGLVQSGHQFMDQNNFAVAAECYRRALAIDGSDTDVRTDFGACLHGMGLPERALQEFNKVLAEKPNHVIATFNKGIVFMNLNQSDSARVWFQKVVTLDADPQMIQRAKELVTQLGG